MADIIKLRRDTAANWFLADPILAVGEKGIETDTLLEKVGDGVTEWSQLPYSRVECMSEPGQSEVQPMSQKAVTDVFNILASGAKVALSLSPSTIYKNVLTNVTLTGTMSGSVPTEMKLMDGATVLKISEASPISHTISISQSTNTHTYNVIGTTMGIILNGSATLNARHPIYYGFAASAAALAVDANRYNPTTTAAHTYEKTASASGNHFYILVPSDISGLSNFSMGGAPFVMQSSVQTIGGIEYKVYMSANIYNSGTTVTVVAS